jgi:hypothetical protein
MKKQHFIFTVFIIAIAIFSILPIMNYIIDPSRILHHDYETRYKKFHPHKLFLKVDYLLEHKEDYDTLVYGSSRGRFVDVSKISKKAYNMSHGFGTVTTYLHSLKTLLNNGVKVKNVWIGVNDFVIWKDHTPNLHRLINKNNFIQDIPIYVHWLFRFIPETVKILQYEYPLVATKEVTDPNQRSDLSRKQEKILNKLHNRNIMPATLGYTGKFRVDKAINEIRQIKELCLAHDINLTVWMYPIYYKTYLSYGQNIINEFKRKLVKVTNFYDFYDFSSLSKDENNWFEGSHFTTSAADYMIKNIQENNFLISSKNIDTRIQKTTKYLKDLAFLKLKDRGKGKGRTLYIDKSIDISIFNKILDLDNHIFNNKKTHQYSFKRISNGVVSEVKGIDPIVIVEKLETISTNVIITVSMHSQHNAVFQLFFKDNPSDPYTENNTYRHRLRKGENNFNIMFPSKYITNGLRIDFSNKRGKYLIQDITIREITLP